MGARALAFVVALLVFGIRSAHAADSWADWENEVEKDEAAQKERDRRPFPNPAEIHLESDRQDAQRDFQKGAPLAVHGFAWGLGAIFMQPRLADTRFSGGGRPFTGGPRMAFNHTGREMGVGSPFLAGADLSMTYFERYFEVGGRFIITGHAGGQDTPTSAEAGSIADGSSVTMSGGALYAAARLPLGGPFTLVLGPDVGVRSISVGLPGFQPTVCRSKSGTYACPETASVLQLYVQPRAALQIKSRTPSGRGISTSFFLMPWVGADVSPAPSFAGGFTFGFSFDAAGPR